MRILLIEDDPKINELLRLSFESEYFAVDASKDGEEGFHLATTNEYDIIVLDSMLPRKSGIEICRDLRGQGIKTPIIGLSVESETVNKVGFLNAGADDYLTKPFSFEELIARIRALLRRGDQLRSDIVEIADLMLDCKRHTLTKEGKEIYLTRKEFLLLEYLMKNQGTVLSRGMILDHVWDMNADPFTNTIETHIMMIRRKISDSKVGRLIQTIPGVGYKIDMT